MIRIWLAVAGFGGLLSVAAGALAAHAAADPHMAELLRTGALYGLVHAAALLAVIAAAERRERRGVALAIAGWGFAVGIVLFSVSLFALALTGIERFGLVTPLGGGCLMIGWAALGLRAFYRR
ncbi:MAG: DUF423 domain-containing protein [Stellaceae bacterium]